MEPAVSTDAQGASFDWANTLHKIHSGLTSRDVKAAKFLCSDFIPPGSMEKVKTAHQLFSELQTRRKIHKPDNVLCIAEILLCIQQQRLISSHLPYTVAQVQKVTDEGNGCLHPCRVLLYHISEHITKDRLDEIGQLCTQITKSAMEKIKDPLDLFHTLEKLNLIDVDKRNLEFLRKILFDVDLREEVNRIDRFLECSKATNALSSTPAMSQNCPRPHFQSPTTNVPRNIRTRSPYETSSSNMTTSMADHLKISSPPRPLFESNMPRPPSQTVGAQSSSLCGLSLPTMCTEDLPDDDRNDRPVANEAGKDDPNLYYTMTHEPKGICLIISNENFHGDKPLEARKGSEIDCKLLRKVFGTMLNFQVEVRLDLTNEEIIAELERIAAMDHSSYDCFICCIMSHGEEGVVYGANGVPVVIKDITGSFVPYKCRGLLDKPKLFFIQACQGQHYQAACDIQVDSNSIQSVASTSAGVAPLSESIPEFGDFFLCLSTVPGCVSFRSSSTGSWFITTLEKMLRKYAHSDDLKSIVTHLNFEVSRAAQRKDGRVCKQVAMETNTLRKKVKFL